MAREIEPAKVFLLMGAIRGQLSALFSNTVRIIPLLYQSTCEYYDGKPFHRTMVLGTAGIDSDSPKICLDVFSLGP